MELFFGIKPQTNSIFKPSQQLFTVHISCARYTVINQERYRAVPPQSLQSSAGGMENRVL